MVKDDTLQWIGAGFILAGHTLNSIGGCDPWNIAAFAGGTAAFLAWAWRVRNRAQVLVNIVSAGICLAGLFRAIA